MKVFKYNSKLVGVTFEGRQAVISTLKGNEKLRTRREPENEYDKNAVAVDVLTGKEWLPIGYIAKDKNQEIAKSMDAGEEINIVLSNITGGDGKSYGINIELSYNQAPEVKEEQEVVKVAPSRDTMKNVLEYLLEVVKKPAKNTDPIIFNSVLLGKNIEVKENNGHISLDGYLSGSRFPAQFYEEFDKDKAVDLVLDKHYADVSKEERESVKKQIFEMWDINGTASTSFGTGIHAAMENYDKNYELGDKIKSVKTFKTKPPVVGDNKALNRNPFIKNIVQDFHKQFGGDYIRFNEQFVWDREFKLCGSIDRVKVVDLKKRIIRIQDFKTDADIHEKKYQLTSSPFYKLTQGKEATMGKELLDLHWLQLSFYAFILARAGWTVEGLDVYWLNGETLKWEEFSHDVIDINEAIIGD